MATLRRVRNAGRAQAAAPKFFQPSLDFLFLISNIAL
ncbi:hypothetical protein PSYMO_34297, partial [Pseudomonas amygdali pv. mori str. 301020]